MKKTATGTTEAGDHTGLSFDGQVEDDYSKKTVNLLHGDGGISEPLGELEGCVVGRFRLEEEIARGGMGIIFRSHDQELNREVAVKLLLKRHLGKEKFRQQFTNEAMITGRLQHPDDRVETVAVMSQLRLGQPVVQFQNRYLAADGTWRCLEWTAKSVSCGSNHLCGCSRRHESGSLNRDFVLGRASA